MVRLPRLHGFISLAINTRGVHNSLVVLPVSRQVQEPVYLSCILFLLARSVNPALTVDSLKLSDDALSISELYSVELIGR